MPPDPCENTRAGRLIYRHRKDHLVKNRSGTPGTGIGPSGYPASGLAPPNGVKKPKKMPPTRDKHGPGAFGMLDPKAIVAFVTDLTSPL